MKEWSTQLKYLNRLQSNFENNRKYIVNALVDLAKETSQFGEIVSWWDGTCDKDLLFGIFKYGFNCGEQLKNDSNFCFQRKLEEEDDDERLMKDDSDDEKVVVKMTREFPSDVVLYKRTKAIIVWLDKKIKMYMKEEEMEEDEYDENNYDDNDNNDNENNNENEENYEDEDDGKIEITFNDDDEE